MEVKTAFIVYRESLGPDILQEVTRALVNCKIEYLIAERKKLLTYQHEAPGMLEEIKKSIGNVDLVVTIGGDGTFLRTAQLVKGIPMFGINPDPKVTEGYYTSADRSNFRKRLGIILSKKAKFRELMRLQAYIKDRPVSEPALNEYYIGYHAAYHTARYIIRIGSKKELQKSSGVLVATPTGSTAWIKSAGGQEIDTGAEDFQYLVREFYHGKLMPECKLTGGILKKNQHVEITSKMQNGVIVADGVSLEHPLAKGETVKISVSRNPVKIPVF